ncbi:unnamed protein product [Prunus armeniaca]|uniref:Uncharacterized protein n=1 Tax=Prunus armeniaca TaxID=36596 RepID=A0A6J5U5W4_PRUAR|nr:unnamed protein product [Prunus armeniaca]
MCSSSKAGSDTLHSGGSLQWRDLSLTDRRQIDSRSLRQRRLSPADETLHVQLLYLHQEPLCISPAIMNASVMSNMVWLLGQSNGSSVMLDCPFGKLGNLNYYFPKPEA